MQHDGTPNAPNHFQAQLLQDHPEIVSIVPRLKLDDQGRPTGNAVIVIGVRKINPLRFGPGAPRPQGIGIPDRFPVITVQGAEDHSQFVEVIVEDEGEIVLQSFTG